MTFSPRPRALPALPVPAPRPPVKATNSTAPRMVLKIPKISLWKFSVDPKTLYPEMTYGGKRLIRR